MNQPFWTITLGNILTIGSGCGALLALWWRTAQRDQRTEDHIASIIGRLSRSEESLDQLSRVGLLTTIAQHERRILDCEKVISDIREMQTDVSWIKETLRRK